jgi:outer membrane protein OmpA-like peptidoglycan-associated protein
MDRRSTLPATLAFVLAAGLLSIPAPGRAEGFNAQVLRLAPVGRGTLTIDGTEALGSLEIEGSALFSWASSPVEMSDDNGRRVGGVLDALGTLDLRVALGLPLGFEAGVTVPLVLERRTPARFEDLGGAGFGDVGLALRWSATPRGPDPIGLAVLASVTAPTGDEVALAGTGTVAGEVDVVAEASAGRVRALLLVGVRGAPEQTRWRGAVRGAELAWGSAFELALDPARRFRVSAEAAGGIGLGQSGVLAEAIGSARWVEGPFALSAGMGAGLTDEPGVPDLRVLVGVGVRTTRSGEGDPDRDGLWGAADRCPTAREDDDGFQDDDGCPDADNDGDSVSDAADRCPMRAEDPDGFQDEDGCPDGDNDEDHVVDANDRCPNEPEDGDGVDDEDGCPDGDNDGDGVADAADRCPAQPENANGFEDTDGCPDTPPAFVFRPREPVVFNDLDFRTASADLLPRAIPVLDQIVASLQAQPDVRVRIEGHTDDRGNDGNNLVLSQRRALAVVNYLAGAGVDARRLEHAGYGETQPIESNDTPAGRARNRRVVIVALDR